jgi:hypothetical protein
MKKTIIATLVTAGLALTSGAKAQSSYNAGDSLLYFRSTAGTGSGKSLVINLGSIGVAGTDYNGTRNFTSFNLDLSAADSIASLTYGTNWWNNINLRWGVVGATPYTASNTNPLSYTISGVNTPINLSQDARYSLAVDVINFTGYSFFSPVSTTNRIGGTRLYGVSDNGWTGVPYEQVTEDANGNFTTNVIANDASIIYSEGTDIAAYDKGGFGDIMSTPSKEISIVTSMNLYAANNTIDRSTEEITNGAPVEIGTISVSNGVISVVPEPSTYALIGLGALLLILAFRRANT